MKTPAIPLRFTPVYQPYIWGGEKLRTRLGREDTPEGIVAESWEVSDREDGMSVVSGGPLDGTSFRELIEKHGREVLGGKCGSDRFPLLIKVLDAAKTLSVQVHPNDATAAEYGGEAKTEMWYVIEADPEAAVYCGLVEEATPGAFRQAIAANELEPMLKKIKVQEGDAVFVPGGRVHAIADGCLLLEVQQNSNTTYRIYDWGRVGSDGNPRELHIDQALEVIQWEDHADALTLPEPLSDLSDMPREKIMESPYFLLERLTVEGEHALPGAEESFQVLFAIDGDLTVEAGGETVEVPKGASALIPACVESATLTALPGATRVMRITLP